jgi:hypothetical protein
MTEDCTMKTPAFTSARASAIALAALVAAWPVSAQMMSDWDTDASGGLSREEWAAGIESGTMFDDWDADGNAAVNEAEFADGLFGRFDADDDSGLTATEWDAGIARWYGEDAVDIDFDRWDANADGTLSSAEFRTGFRSAGLYDEFRTSANLSTTDDEIERNAFRAGVYDWMDRNRDEQLDAGESRFME